MGGSEVTRWRALTCGIIAPTTGTPEAPSSLPLEEGTVCEPGSEPHPPDTKSACTVSWTSGLQNGEKRACVAAAAQGVSFCQGGSTSSRPKQCPTESLNGPGDFPFASIP